MSSSPSPSLASAMTSQSTLHQVIVCLAYIAVFSILFVLMVVVVTLLFIDCPLYCSRTPVVAPLPVNELEMAEQDT
jgi:hypothetical protein